MLLEIKNLAVGFDTERGLARAVDGVSFSVRSGRAFCLVGESGCGKSVTALSILGLLPSPPSRILSGEVFFEGVDLLLLPERELNRLRGSRIGMIFQEPMTSLNPVFRVGDQVAEPLCLHRGLNKTAALERAVELLDQVGIKEPALRARDYPHQLSGGMRQRVMIAMAMACGPALLIADEPTTALDVSIQGQILDLMREMRESTGSALLMITHDLDVVARSADEMAVMYAGRIVESGSVREILSRPLHPYTVGLIASRPRLSWNAESCNARRSHPADSRPGLSMEKAGTARDQSASLTESLARARAGRLEAIPGTVPPPLERPDGCAFSNRCPKVFDKCRAMMPGLLPPRQPGEPAVPANNPGLADGARLCRCWLYQ